MSSSQTLACITISWRARCWERNLSDSLGLGWSLMFCISEKFRSGLDAADQEPPLRTTADHHHYNPFTWGAVVQLSQVNSTTQWQTWNYLPDFTSLHLSSSSHSFLLFSIFPNSQPTSFHWRHSVIVINLNSPQKYSEFLFRNFTCLAYPYLLNPFFFLC